VKLNFGNTGSQRKIGKLQILGVIFLIRQCIAAPKILVMQCTFITDDLNGPDQYKAHVPGDIQKKNPDQAVLVLIQPQRYGDYHNFHLVTNNYYLDPKWSTRLSNRVWKVTLAE
jgi:hypothetical protein